MVFGMTSRLCGPTNKNDVEARETYPLWQYWAKVELSEMDMVGWWEDTPLVSTGDDQVKATVWRRQQLEVDEKGQGSCIRGHAACQGFRRLAPR